MRNIFWLAALLLTACTGVDDASTSPKEGYFKVGSIHADADFDGARLNKLEQIDDAIYRVTISPEALPVNNSPWYAFRLWSDDNLNIELEIAYTDSFKNRYLPKRSKDGEVWQTIDSSLLSTDTTTGILTINLELGPEKLWIAAQENLNTPYIENWIDQLAERPTVEKAEIGNSVLGHPLLALTVAEGRPEQALFIVGRQHPPEVPGGTISLMNFVEEVLGESELATQFRERFAVYMVSLANPDGVSMGHWRHNANGVDLNRDWIDFTQPETQLIRDWMLSRPHGSYNQGARFGIDFHTSYSGPYLLTLDTIPHRVSPQRTNQWIASIESQLQEELDIRPRSQDFPYCYNWFINQLGVEAVTYEEGDEKPRSEIRERARLYARILMEVLLSND